MDGRLLARIQALSGLVFSLFLVLHLATTLSTLAGPGAYDAVQHVVRGWYQTVPVELAGVFGALGVHVWAGVTLGVRRRRRAPDAKPPLVLRLHRWTGYGLLAVV